MCKIWYCLQSFFNFHFPIVWKILTQRCYLPSSSVSFNYLGFAHALSFSLSLSLYVHLIITIAPTFGLIFSAFYIYTHIYINVGSTTVNQNFGANFSWGPFCYPLFLTYVTLIGPLSICFTEFLTVCLVFTFYMQIQIITRNIC